MGWLGLSALILALGQDLGEAEEALKKGIENGDLIETRAAITVLSDLKTPEAIDVLLAGVGWTKRAESSLEKKLDSVIRGVETADRKRDAARQVYRDARGEWRDDRENEALKAKMDAAEAKEDEARAEYNRARRAVGGHKQRILNQETIRNLLFASLGDFEDVGHLVGRFRKAKKDWALRAGIASGLGRVRSEEALKALLELFDDENDPTVRMSIIDALGTRENASDGVVELLRGALEDEAWQVIYSALQVIVRFKILELIEPLVEKMQKEDGRLRHDIRDALVKLTGVDKGDSPAAWKTWFEQNREAILSGTYKPRPEEKSGAGAMTRMTFFGIPVKSKRVVFVLDRSGSMKEPADWVPEIGTGEKTLPNEIRKPAGERKIDIARWQLKKILYLLPEGTLFNIVFYRDEFEVFKPKMVRLDKRSRKAAYKWIDDVEPDGGTNVYDSLERAMQFAMNKDGGIDPEGADTIYLLSDGLPNQGKFTGAGDIRREVGRRNDRLKMVIHTIWVGGVVPEGGGIMDQLKRQQIAQGVKFMEGLAEENGGKHVSTAPKKVKNENGD